MCRPVKKVKSRKQRVTAMGCCLLVHRAQYVCTYTCLVLSYPHACSLRSITHGLYNPPPSRMEFSLSVHHWKLAWKAQLAAECSSNFLMKACSTLMPNIRVYLVTSSDTHHSKILLFFIPLQNFKRLSIGYNVNGSLTQITLYTVTWNSELYTWHFG